MTLKLDTMKGESVMKLKKYPVTSNLGNAYEVTIKESKYYHECSFQPFEEVKVALYERIFPPLPIPKKILNVLYLNKKDFIKKFDGDYVELIRYQVRQYEDISRKGAQIDKFRNWDGKV